MSTTTTTTTTAPPFTLSSHDSTTNTDSTRNDDPSYIPTGDVTAKLTFFLPPADGSAPYNFVEEPPAGVPRSNYGTVEEDVVIHDIRGHESEFTLDNDAFEVLNATTSPDVDFDSEDSIKSTYYSEVEQLLLDKVPGAHKIIIFDHTIRRAGTNREPVNRTHIDQTAAAAAERVRLHADPAEYEALVKGRYRIINVWRPLNGPVQKHPLAVAAARSVRDEDLIGVEHRYPNRTGETAAVQFDKEQSWWFLSGMRDEERLLLKCADSADVPGKRVPHTAFKDERSPVGGKERASIEVRTLVFG